MTNNETINKIVRKKVLWAEINAKEVEYNRIQNQINQLRNDQHALKHNIQLKLKECEEIAEWMLEKEANCLIENKK